MMSRRSMLFAPAMVAAANLMPVRSIARLLLPAEPYVEFIDALGKLPRRRRLRTVMELRCLQIEP
jgi:hypothetical protein